MSLLSRGAWIEIPAISSKNFLQLSLLSRGAWIEILLTSGQARLSGSLLSRGAWIEIKSAVNVGRFLDGRSSHEERGLKLIRTVNSYIKTASLLSRGAWIEINQRFRYPRYNFVAPLTRSVD